MTNEDTAKVRVVLLKNRKGDEFIAPQTVTSAIYDPEFKETLQQKLDRKTDKSFSVAAWDETTEYADMATVVFGGNHTLFMSMKDGNIGHQPTLSEGEWWTPVKGIDPTAPKVHLELIPPNSTVYTVHHGLDDEDVVFSLRDEYTKKYVNADVEYVDTNNLRVTFAKATVNQIRMFIMASPRV